MQIVEGTYEITPRVINGLPMWKQSGGEMALYMHAEGIWYVAPESEVSQRKAFMISGCARTPQNPCNVRIWVVERGGTWAEDVDAKCLEVIVAGGEDVPCLS